MSRSILMVDARDLPALAWAWVAFLIWTRLWPKRWQFVGIGNWLLPWAGYWAFHPLHEGWSAQELREFPAP